MHLCTATPKAVSSWVWAGAWQLCALLGCNGATAAAAAPLVGWSGAVAVVVCVAAVIVVDAVAAVVAVVAAVAAAAAVVAACIPRRRVGWHGLLRLPRCCSCCGCGAAALLRTAVQLRLLREQARQQATWQVRRTGCGCGCCCGALLRLRRLRLMRVGRPARGCCSCDTGPRLESCTMGCPVGACWLPYGGLRAIFMSGLQMTAMSRH